MRKFIKATVLTLTLAVSTLAGDMGAPIAPPGEMGNGKAAITAPAKTGDIGCPIAGSEIAMTLLKTLLVLF